MSVSRKLASLVALATPVMADSGDDFSNNMFSDLAPLLALFGERVTMQFMSQSMGWADNITLAMAPLGIITTVVSAIRVGGPSWLKALVGRARENLAVAEAELMSSTSHEVCELWNGQQVVRCMGTAPVVEFICLLPATMPDKGATTQPKITIIDLKKARDDHYLERMGRFEHARRLRPVRISHNTLDRPNKDQEKEPDLSTEVVIIGKKLDKALPAPNISLNCHSYFWRGELRAIAALGTILQLGVLVYSGLATYHPALRFQKEDRPIAHYAYPCTAIGTLVMVAGVMLCAHVVESSTTEKRYQPRRGKKARLLWLQQAKTVNDQAFDSFAIFAEDDRSVITTSHRATHSLDETDEHSATPSSDDAQRPPESLNGRPSSTSSRAPSWSFQSDTPREATRYIRLRKIWRGARVQDMATAPVDGIRIPADTTGTAGKAGRARGDITSRSNKPNNATSPRVEIRRKERSVDAILVSKTVVGTIVCLGGFIVQFIGMRGMHWSASVAQLGAVIVMTGFRAWARRGLAKPPRCLGLSPGFELEWFATTLGDVGSAPWLAPDSNSEATIKPASSEEEATDDPADEKGDTKDWRIVTGGGPETHQKFDENNDDSKAYTVMVLRRKLGRLAHWRGPASAEAIALTRAIEITMDTLFRPDSGEDLDELSVELPDKLPDEHPDELTWSLRAHYAGSGAQPIYFRLRKKDGQWKALSDEIDAALSLWLYSVNRLEQARSEQQQQQTQTARETNRPMEDDEWFRQEESREKRNLRLLGPASRALRRDLQWWIPHDISRVLEVEEDKDGKLEVQNHRIVGCGLNPAAVEELEQGGEDTGDRRQGLDCRTRYKIQELPTKFDPDDKKAGDGEAEGTLLATESHGALQLLYAQDMLSAFVWSMAKTMAPVQEDADIRPDGTGERDGWKSFTLWNKKLSKMIQDIHNTGLGTLDQIYLSIIPPLSVQQRLPRPEVIVDLARKQARPHEQLQQWNEARMVYTWLFRTAVTFPESSGIATSGIAVLMEYLRTVTLGLGWRETQQVGTHELKLLSFIKAELEYELRTAGGGTLLNLMRLYKAQGRGWECVPVQEAQCDLVEGPGYPKAFKLTKLHTVASEDSDGFLGWEILREADINSTDIHHWTPLHYAAMKGQQYAVTGILKHLGGVNARDLIEWTPLHYACIHGDISIVQELIGSGAEVDARGRDGVAPLHNAAINGHGDVVRSLIEAGAVIDGLDASGNTPLLWAAYSGHENVVGELWRDANRRLRSHNGRTALHLAVIAGREAIVRLLVEHGTDIDTKDSFSWTPLYYAVRGGIEVVVRLLVERGADKDARDISQETLLHHAARTGHKCIARFLIEGGADKDSRNLSGETPLHLAAREGNVDIARLLIKDGADAGAKNAGGWTPLHYAAVERYEGVIRLLIVEGGADTGAKDAGGWTPLHYAAVVGFEGVIRLLIVEGDADMGAKDSAGWTPLHVLSMKRYERVAKVWTPIRHAHIARLLVEIGADTGAKDNEGKTPLCYASIDGFEDIARLLIESGADTGAKDNEGKTPLHYTSIKGREHIARLLIEIGADTGAKDNGGKTPLHYASMQGYEDVARLLTEGGADTGAKDYWGKTLLYYDPRKRYKDITRILIAAGADIGAKDNKGKTPLYYASREGYEEASREGYEEVARILIEAGADKGAKDNEGKTPLHL